MARPRVFISSTYYDLRYLRSDLEKLCLDLGYDSVLFERGQVAYHTRPKIEDSCYREIENCDIVVTVVGSRFGTAAAASPYSITQKELLTALELGKPVYVLVEQAVADEYRTYEANANRAAELKFVAVDDIRVYEFLGQIFGLPNPQPIQSFRDTNDIVRFLREQWAGLFQSLLRESGRRREIEIIEQLQAMVASVEQVSSFMTKQLSQGGTAIQDLVLSTHPLFERIKKTLDIPYRVFFLNLSELNSLFSARKTRPVSEEKWDEPTVMEWLCSWKEPVRIVKIRKSLFDKNGLLKAMAPETWKDTYFATEDYAEPAGQPEPQADVPAPAPSKTLRTPRRKAVAKP